MTLILYNQTTELIWTQEGFKTGCFGASAPITEILLLLKTFWGFLTPLLAAKEMSKYVKLIFIIIIVGITIY